LDIVGIGEGLSGEEVGDGTGKPVALVDAVGPAPFVGDGEGEGFPAVEDKGDAELEFGLSGG
jgi:hypothetical protein